MARGWESKSVEAQQDSAAAAVRSPGPALTAAEADRRTKRDTLMLARLRVLGDLQTACAAAHRAMLEQAIVDLDAQLAALDRSE